MVSIAFEAIAVATAMPVAAQDLNGIAYYAWAFSLFVIGMLLATVLAGRVCDRIGPSRPLLVGLGVFAVGLVVAGTAETMLQLVGGRFVQGLGGGALNTAMFVMVAKAYRPAQRPRMFTYISTAWVLPSFVGPPDLGLADLAPVLALGVLRRHPAGRFGGRWCCRPCSLMRIPMPPEERPDRPEPAPLWAAGVVALAARRAPGGRPAARLVAVSSCSSAGLVLSGPRRCRG